MLVGCEKKQQTRTEWEASRESTMFRVTFGLRRSWIRVVRGSACPARHAQGVSPAACMRLHICLIISRSEIPIQQWP